GPVRVVHHPIEEASVRPADAADAAAGEGAGGRSSSSPGYSGWPSSGGQGSSSLSPPSRGSSASPPPVNVHGFCGDGGCSVTAGYVGAGDKSLSPPCPPGAAATSPSAPAPAAGSPPLPPQSGLAALAGISQQHAEGYGDLRGISSVASTWGSCSPTSQARLSPTHEDGEGANGSRAGPAVSVSPPRSARGSAARSRSRTPPRAVSPAAATQQQSGGWAAQGEQQSGAAMAGIPDDLFGAPARGASPAPEVSPPRTVDVLGGAPDDLFGAPAASAFSGSSAGQAEAIPEPQLHQVPVSAPPADLFGAAPAGSGGFDAPSQAAAAGAFSAPLQASAAGAFSAPPQASAADAFGAPPQASAADAFGAPPQASAANAFGAPSQASAADAFGAPPQ
ncbi:unnamed protein product, partial [Chrysoparadoxa australica]